MYIVYIYTLYIDIYIERESIWLRARSWRCPGFIFLTSGVGLEQLHGTLRAVFGPACSLTMAWAWGSECRLEGLWFGCSRPPPQLSSVKSDALVFGSDD